MYTCVNSVWDTVKSVARCRSNADEILVMQKICNTCYMELCAMTSWIHLRSSQNYIFSAAPDSTGFWLPGDLLGIDSVRGDVNAGLREYILRDQSGVAFDENTWRYYFSDISVEPLVAGDDLVLENGSNTFQSASLAVDYTGQYIKFGTEPGIYLLTSQFGFTPAYNGPPVVADGDYQIRPQGTRKFTIIDPSGQFDKQSTVNVYYWKMPPPLYKASDLILLPSSRPLELMTLIRFIGQMRKNEIDAGIYRAELMGPDGKSGVLHSMVQSNPSFPKSRGARDVRNNKMTYSGDIFTQRGIGANGSQGNVQNDSWLSWANNG